ncbi:MAG: nucleotidyltransferase family protein [Desulfobacterales bacterium]|nr:nucleotidyltransferase family protein [Desulfobacterales bacterium]
MKAVLLAAGLGTRLKPLTDRIPKCLIPIQGKPLLEIWIDLLEKHRFREVLINTHHHAAQVEEFIARKKKRAAIKITLFNEPELLGSGGTLLANKAFVCDEKDFLIAYSDNLTNMDLDKFIDFHRLCIHKGAILTMGLFHAQDPRACGIAVLDKGQRIVKFTEKPETPESDLANGGIYMATGKIFNFFPEANSPKGIIDLGKHVLPALCGKMYGYKVTAYLRDIGTLESYRKALEEWPDRPESKTAL